MFFFLMLLHFLLVLKLWEVSSLDLSIETLQSQPRNLKSSQLLLIIKLKSEFKYIKVREKWLLITKSLEILSSLEFQWPQEDIHKLRLLSILMPMVFLTFQPKIRALVNLKPLPLDQVEVSVTLKSNKWFKMLKPLKSKIKQEEK